MTNVVLLPVIRHHLSRGCQRVKVAEGGQRFQNVANKVSNKVFNKVAKKVANKVAKRSSSLSCLSSSAGTCQELSNFVNS